jgi:hypothetical protein
MRAKYSPTISERYTDRHWWTKNGGGFGLLSNGRSMTSEYQNYDHEGFDPFGYASNGRDRKGYTVRDYESSDELYSDVAAEWRQKPPTCKTVSAYWGAVASVIDRLVERFPHLPVSLPQQKPEGPGVSIYLIEGGGYGVAVRLPDVDGLPRTMDIRFDDGTGGSSPYKPEWSVNVITNACGEITRNALCLVETSEAAVRFASEEIADYDPDRFIHDVTLVEGGDGVSYLKAVPYGVRSNGDVIGSVHAIDAATAIAKVASRFRPGGPVTRMAERGISRLRREQAPENPAEFSADHIRPTRGLSQSRGMTR